MLTTLPLRNGTQPPNPAPPHPTQRLTQRGRYTCPSCAVNSSTLQWVEWPLARLVTLNSMGYSISREAVWGSRVCGGEQQDRTGREEVGAGERRQDKQQEWGVRDGARHQLQGRGEQRAKCEGTRLRKADLRGRWQGLVCSLLLGVVPPACPQLTQPVQCCWWQDDLVAVVGRLLVDEGQREGAVGGLKGAAVVASVPKHPACAGLCMHRQRVQRVCRRERDARAAATRALVPLLFPLLLGPTTPTPAAAWATQESTHMPTSRLCLLGYSRGALCAEGEELLVLLVRSKLVQQQDEGSASPWVWLDSGGD